jgi:hypothetical protein
MAEIQGAAGNKRRESALATLDADVQLSSTGALRG